MINEKRRQLTTELVNGDQVKVLTDKDAKPKSEWEDYAVTGRAKSAIKRFIRMEKQSEFGRVGKALLEREYRFRKTPFDEQVIISALSAFKLTTIEELYVHIAEQRIKTREVFEQLHPEMALANGRDKTGRKRSADACHSRYFQWIVHLRGWRCIWGNVVTRCRGIVLLASPPQVRGLRFIQKAVQP